MITLPGRSPTLIGGHFAKHYDQFAGATLRELAGEYGVSRSTMRSALRQARPRLARDGRTLTVPVRDDEYVIVVTDELAVARYRLLSRLAPITTEFTRYAEDLTVLGDTSSLDELIDALYSVADHFIDELLATP